MAAPKAIRSNRKRIIIRKRIHDILEALALEDGISCQEELDYIIDSSHGPGLTFNGKKMGPMIVSTDEIPSVPCGGDPHHPAYKRALARLAEYSKREAAKDRPKAAVNLDRMRYDILRTESTQRGIQIQKMLEKFIQAEDQKRHVSHDSPRDKYLRVKCKRSNCQEKESWCPCLNETTEAYVDRFVKLAKVKAL